MKNETDLSPNDVTFNSLIDCCVRSGNTSKAWQLLEEMNEVGVAPDNFTYSTLVKGIRAGDKEDLERAFELLSEMKSAS